MKRLGILITLSLVLVLSIGMTSVRAAAVTLRYANWNVGTAEENNIQRQLIAAYMQAHPDVTIEFVDMSGDGRWDEKLTNYAAKGALPDVFMADGMPLYIKNEWTADLTAMVADDADWKDVPQVLKDAVTHSGKVLGLPAAQFVLGYWINQDIFEAANLDAPVYGASLDDFLSAVQAVANVQKGVLGLNEMEPILGWYPSTQDSKLKWFGFDGSHMNYNSAAFKSAVAKATELLPDTWQGLTDDLKTNFKSKGPWELFLNQEVGAQWDGGWVVPDYAKKATFNWDFLGIPGGNQAMVTDIIVVSKTAPDMQAAYDFTKWMTFSKDGYAKEAELAKAASGVPSRMPVSVNADSINLYLSLVGEKAGLRKALENLTNSPIESLAKVVPGYINARWEGKPGIDIGDNKDVNMGFIFGNSASGMFKFEDYSAQLETFANKTIDDAIAQLPK